MTKLSILTSAFDVECSMFDVQFPCGSVSGGVAELTLGSKLQFPNREREESEDG